MNSTDFLVHSLYENSFLSGEGKKGGGAGDAGNKRLRLGSGWKVLNNFPLKGEYRCLILTVPN